jgi:hypothetical protein
MEKTKRKSKDKINYIGKFAKIKEEVEIDKNDQLFKVHNYPYKIIEQKDDEMIYLETKVFATFASDFSTSFEVIDRSFWMNINECEIIEK